MNRAVERYLRLRDNPHVQTALNVVGAAEGTNRHGYHTAFGGDRIESLADHPRGRRGFTQTDGKRNVSSAAGRYQFIAPTWDSLANRLGLEDFGPVNQDVAAIALLEESGALGPILQGDIMGGLDRAGRIWASLPSSPYPQPKRSREYIQALIDGQPTPRTGFTGTGGTGFDGTGRARLGAEPPSLDAPYSTLNEGMPDSELQSMVFSTDETANSYSDLTQAAAAIQSGNVAAPQFSPTSAEFMTAQRHDGTLTALSELANTFNPVMVRSTDPQASSFMAVPINRGGRNQLMVPTNDEERQMLSDISVSNATPGQKQDLVRAMSMVVPARNVLMGRDMMGGQLPTTLDGYLLEILENV